MPDSDHAHSRRGATRTQWPAKMEPWVTQWVNAHEDLVQEDAPYDPTSYDEYLRWYAPRTRTRLVHVVDPLPDRVPAPTDAYPVHFMRNLHVATDITIGIANDGQSILDRASIGAEVTREDLFQFVHQACSAARRVISLTSYRKVSDVATSAHTPRLAHPTAQLGGSGGPRPRAPPTPAPWQLGSSGWACGYAPPQPPAPSSLQYPVFPDPYGQYGCYDYDYLSHMAPDSGFQVRTQGLLLFPPTDVDVYFAEPPGEARGAAEPAPVEALSGCRKWQ